MENLFDVLIDQLSAIYNAKKQELELFPRLISSANSGSLTALLEAQLSQTKEQLYVLEDISSDLKVPLKKVLCDSISGLKKEADRTLRTPYSCKSLGDAMVVCFAQKMKHYSIAAYGNARTVALF